MNHSDLARLCSQAYTDAGVPDADLDVQAPFRHGPRAIVLHEADRAVIVYRGSADPECWLTNLDDVMVPCPLGGRVHEGFWLYWQAVRARVLGQVGGRPVIVAGHSLGGAMATLCAMELGAQVEQVVTFGAPRVGDRALCDAYLPLVGRTTRYVNQFDPVPWVPSLLRGFRDVCAKLWFDGAIWRPYRLKLWCVKLALRVFSDWPVTPSEVAGILRRQRDYHQIQSYVEALQ